VAGDFEPRILSFAAATLVPEHFEEVRIQREKSIDRTLARMRERELTLQPQFAPLPPRIESAALVFVQGNAVEGHGMNCDISARIYRKNAKNAIYSPHG